MLSYSKCPFPNNNNKNSETCKDTSITHAHKAEKRKLPVRVNKCGVKSENFKVTTISMSKEVKYLKK